MQPDSHEAIHSGLDRSNDRRGFMNVKSTIQWATPYSLGLLLACAVAALAASYSCAGPRAGRSRRPVRVGLLVIRLAILAILGLIILNPVRVDETPGTVERPKVFYLLDTSQSMAIGKGTTRWEQVVGRSATPTGPATRGAGPRSACSGSAAAWPPWTRTSCGPKRGAGSRPGARPARRWPPSRRAARSRRPAPTDSDTLLGASLEGLDGSVRPGAASGGGRLLRRPRPRPRSGRHDRAGLRPDEGARSTSSRSATRTSAATWPSSSMVAPNQVRKSSKVAAQVFVRSFGYKGQRAELKIVAVGARRQAGVRARPDAGRPPGWPEELLARRSSRATRTAASRPGSTRSRARSRRRTTPSAPTWRSTTPRSACSTSKGRPSASSSRRSSPVFGGGAGPRGLFAAPGSADGGPGHRVHGRDARPGRRAISRSSCAPTNGGPGLPEIASELFAYDAIILSNVPARRSSDQHLAWIDEWIGRRGGGLLHGRRSQQLRVRPVERDLGRRDAPRGARPRPPATGTRRRRRSIRSPPGPSTRSGTSRPTRRRTARC